MGKGTISASSMAAAGSDPSQAIALADPSSALSQFKLAAQSIESQYPGALSAFKGYVNKGTSGVLDLNTQALISSLPVSTTAMDTMNELRGYLGMAPVSPTAGLSLKLDNTINKLRSGDLSGTPAADSMVSRLMDARDQLAAAEGISDTGERSSSKAQILSSLNDLGSAIGGLGPEFSSIAGDLQDVQGRFEAGYGQDAAKPPSAADIQAKLEANPAYQFRLSQGMKAIDRSAAAKGNLLSGNTLAAAQQFGQGLASQEYENQVNRLSGLLNQSLPAVYQQQGLLSNMGNTLGQTGQLLGAAAGDTYKQMAQADQQAYTQSGQGLLQSSALQSQEAQQAALTNAQLQQQASQTNAQLAQQAALNNASKTLPTSQQISQAGMLAGQLQSYTNPVSSLPTNYSTGGSGGFLA